MLRWVCAILHSGSNMDTILVVNAGSSSLKFQAFEVSAPEQLTCVVKGQLDGIGTRPRLRAGKSDGQHLIDQNYDATQVKDLPAAIGTAGDWLRTLPGLNLVAVGHRVVHGGPEFDQPILLNADVVSQLERYVPLVPSMNLTIWLQFDRYSPAARVSHRSLVSTLHSIAIMTRWPTDMRYPTSIMPRACDVTAFTACHTNSSRSG